MRISRYKESSGVISDINVTPLVDVVLVLLVVFIVTAPVLKSLIDLDLPREQVQEKMVTNRPIAISLTNGGVIKVNERVVNEEELQHLLSDSAKEKSFGGVHLAADKDCSYEKVLHLIKLIKDAGVANLGFVIHSG